MSRLRRVIDALFPPPAAAAPPALPAAAATGRGAADQARAINALTRQVAELRGLVQQQASFTMEALHRAGWQDDEDAAQQTALARALRSARGSGDLLVGPWTGEVGFELLYWIPFLNWLVERGLDRRRLIVVSRGGAAPWYAHLTLRYVDILDLVSADEFRERTAGPKKQIERRQAFEHELLTKAAVSLGIPDGTEAIHPSAMYRLFAALWRKRSTIDLVESFTRHARLTPPAPIEQVELPDGLPPGYLVAKFYFSKAFPDNAANRQFVDRLVRRLSAEAPLVLLSTATRLDEHYDFATSAGSGLFVLDAHAMPQKNLALQTRVIAGSRGFVGTYGGFSYLAPFLGVRSLSFFSRRFGFESHHLDLANRVFDQLLPGGFLALDRRAIDLASPDIARWMTTTASQTAAGREREAESESEAEDVLT